MVVTNLAERTGGLLVLCHTRTPVSKATTGAQSEAGSPFLQAVPTHGEWWGRGQAAKQLSERQISPLFLPAGEKCVSSF